MVVARISLLCLVMGIALAASPSPAPAQAQGRQAKAKKAFKAGYTALQAGRYAQALAHYERSYRLVARPRTLFNIALCEEKLARYLSSWRHFREFMTKAEARDAPFKARALAQIEALEKHLVGRVTLISVPAGARVRVDGERRSRGRTPITIRLTPGSHSIRLTASGANPAERNVEVAPSSRSTIRMKLELASGVVIQAEPADAMIRRKGDSRSHRGAYRARVRPGRHQFVVSRAGYVREQVIVNVKTGLVHEQHVRLRPSVGMAELTVRSTDTSVSIDGKHRGAASTGADLRTPVAAGNHDLQLRRPGTPGWRGRVHLSPGEKVRVDAQLRSSNKRLRWALIGVSGVALIGGGTLGIMGLRDVTGDPDRHSRGKNRALVADAFFVVGAAAIFTLWRLSKRPSSQVEIRRAHRGN